MLVKYTIGHHSDFDFSQTFQSEGTDAAISLTSPFLSCFIAVSPGTTVVPVLEVQYITVWLCNLATTPPSVWYQSTPSSTWRSSSLSDSRLLKRCLETLSEVCFHPNSFSHGQRPFHTHCETHTYTSETTAFSTVYWGTGKRVRNV